MKLKIFALMLLCCPVVLAETLPREQWGAPLVTVSHADGKWTIAGQKQKVLLDASHLAIEVRAGPTIWRMVPSGTDDLLVKFGGNDLALRLADAQKIEISPYDTGYKTGVKLSLSKWTNLLPRRTNDYLDLTLYLTVCLEGKDEDLVFDLSADERQTLVRRLDWPAALDAHDIDYTALSNLRGVLLPRNWPRPYHPIRSSNPDGTAKTNDTSEAQSKVI